MSSNAREMFDAPRPLVVRETAVLGLCFGGLAFVPLVAPQGAHVLVPLAVLAMRRRPPLTAPVMLFAGAFFAWCALSGLWTDQPDSWASGLVQIVLFASFGLALVGLSRTACETTARRVGVITACGIIAASGLAVFDLLTAGAFHRLVHANPFYDYVANRSATVASVLCWPTAGLLWSDGRARLATATVAAASLAAFIGASGTAALAILVGGVVLALSLFVPLIARRLVAVGGAVAILLAPAAALALAAAPAELVSPFEPQTVLARVQIWGAVGRMISESPLLGHGLDTLRTTPISEVGWLYTDRIASHAHNAALQAWVDLGAPGAVALAVAHAAALRLAGARPSHVAGVAALSVALLTSWNPWSAWWLATIFGVAAALAMGTGARRPRRRTVEAERTPNGLVGSLKASFRVPKRHEGSQLS